MYLDLVRLSEDQLSTLWLQERRGMALIIDLARLCAIFASQDASMVHTRRAVV